MLIILSPSKTLDFSSSLEYKEHTIPDLLDRTEKIIKLLKKLKPVELSALMGISINLAHLNAGRFSAWRLPFTPDNARQAIFAFKGDVYTGFSVEAYGAADLEYAQKHLRILSGLYGVLRPLDLMQPYRLEMGTALGLGKNKDLYEFWQNNITNSIKETLLGQGDNIIVNLASIEYSKVITYKKLGARVISPAFKDRKGDSYQMISFFAKRARGMMASYILLGRISRPEDILLFNEDGYSYNDRLSKPDQPVFTRE